MRIDPYRLADALLTKTPTWVHAGLSASALQHRRDAAEELARTILACLTDMPPEPDRDQLTLAM